MPAFAGMTAVGEGKRERPIVSAAYPPAPLLPRELIRDGSDADIGDAVLDHAEPHRRRLRQIDDAILGERPAVVDAHHHLAAILEIDHAQLACRTARSGAPQSARRRRAARRSPSEFRGHTKKRGRSPPRSRSPRSYRQPHPEAPAPRCGAITCGEGTCAEPRRIGLRREPRFMMAERFRARSSWRGSSSGSARARARSRAGVGGCQEVMVILSGR